jgi:uncharacterized protein YbcI
MSSRAIDSSGAIPAHDHHSGGRIGSAISNSVVRIFAEYLGRGPTRARTSFGRDVVTVVLEETLTKAEQRLVREGEAESVIEIRRTFQRAMRRDLVAAIEQHSGRRVAAFLSDQHVEPDVSAEIFILVPNHDLAQGGEPPQPG